MGFCLTWTFFFSLSSLSSLFLYFASLLSPLSSVLSRLLARITFSLLRSLFFASRWLCMSEPRRKETKSSDEISRNKKRQGKKEERGRENREQKRRQREEEAKNASRRDPNRRRRRKKLAQKEKKKKNVSLFSTSTLLSRSSPSHPSLSSLLSLTLSLLIAAHLFSSLLISSDLFSSLLFSSLLISSHLVSSLVISSHLFSSSLLSSSYPFSYSALFLSLLFVHFSLSVLSLLSFSFFPCVKTNRASCKNCCLHSLHLIFVTCMICNVQIKFA